ncbi:MAG: hypothetical protein ACI81L_001741 [Verrucomicrobiales bacterium]|jgi:hypothetical protein
MLKFICDVKTSMNEPCGARTELGGSFGPIDNWLGVDCSTMVSRPILPDINQRLLRQPFVAILATLALLASACTGSGSGATSSTTPSRSEPDSTNVPVTAEPLPDIPSEPGEPLGVIVVSTADGSVELAWEESRDATVTSYEIVRVSPGGRTERFDVESPAFVDSGLEDGDVYTYQIVAVGESGRSEGSVAVTAKVGVDSNAPKAPGRPSAVESAAGVTIEWSGVTDLSGIANYIVTRTIGGVPTDFDVGSESSFTDDVDAGLVATYSVRAVDTAGNESERSRNTTVLTGTAADRVVVVVSAEAAPENTPATERLQRSLLEAGFVTAWFEDDIFDSNITSEEDVVLLLGDVQGPGFDWNVFATNATVIGMKSLFFEASGITANAPKLDRLAQLDYVPPAGLPREVVLTTTPEPRPVVYIPLNEQLPSLQTWARPVWSDDIAVAGLIPADGELANEKLAPGCRAFYPGNPSSLAEQTDAGWELLVEFIDGIAKACV